MLNGEYSQQNIVFNVVLNSPEQVVRFLLFKGKGAALVGYIVMLRARMFLPLIPGLISWSDQ